MWSTVASAWLLAMVAALRNQKVDTTSGIGKTGNDGSAASHSSLEAVSGTQIRTGAFLRERYVLEEQISENIGPQEGFPKIIRRQFSGETAVLGAGTFGVTWKAYDSQLGKYVAVKIFYDKKSNQYLSWRTANTTQQHWLKSTAQECAMIQKMMKRSDMYIGSSRICQCYQEHVMDAGNTDRPVFLVLELCGSELSGVLAKMASTGETDIVQARRWVKQILEGLAFIEMFDPPLIHHDLKPGNIVVGEHELKLIDWGATIPASRQNELGSAVFTAAYAAPEVLNGSRAFAPPAHSYDVYAVGLMYIEFLCPKVSYRQWTDPVSRRHYTLRAQTIKTMMNRCPGFAADWSIQQDVELIAKMVSRTPSQRPALMEMLGTPPLKNARWEAPAEFQVFQTGDQVEYGGTSRGHITDVRNIDGQYVYDVVLVEGDLQKQGVHAERLSKPVKAGFNKDWLVFSAIPSDDGSSDSETTSSD